ncbi:hypothetical protein IFM89_022925 [Coptis chinensis]|uniref:Uncharacterized protein n=1 Tax=Coptis chinensis TaxID=261450 RepID=A0A835IP72_9MAGN|nr:hypothetical protein IFM89_022925 [Coptis chinensis]
MAPIYFIIIAFPCVVGAIVLAVVHIYRHLMNYTEPTYQRFIVRIIFMVPKTAKGGEDDRRGFRKEEKKKKKGSEEEEELTKREIRSIGFRGRGIAKVDMKEKEKGGGGGGIQVYALMSFLSLLLNESSIYFNSIREVYEAWVIYNFLSLCLAWVGGPGAVVLTLSGRVLKPSWCLMTCCFSPIPLDGRFIRRCKQGALQFVILKPILVALTFILYAKGKYEDGNFSAKQGYLYVTIIYTISYTTALYALALFYMACKDLLRPFNPVPKFIIIKSVVFLTYWQGVLVFLAAKSGFIKNTGEAAEFQNFIVCVEMLIAAVGHLYAFPYKEYAGANIGASGGLTGSLGHALKFNDFYHDTVHQFAPTYHDYVLYNHNEGDDGTRKYRSRTFVPTGQEMDTVRKNKLVIGTRIDEIQLSNSSSSTSTPKNPSTAQDYIDPEAMKSSLLMDYSNSFAQPYDISLVDMDLSSYPAKVPAASSKAVDDR